MHTEGSNRCCDTIQPKKIYNRNFSLILALEIQEIMLKNPQNYGAKAFASRVNSLLSYSPCGSKKEVVYFKMPVRLKL